MTCGNNKKDYCGFVCSDIIDRQRAIVQEIADFSRVNPEFALVMLGRITDIIKKEEKKEQEQIINRNPLNKISCLSGT